MTQQSPSLGELSFLGEGEKINGENLFLVTKNCVKWHQREVDRAAREEARRVEAERRAEADKKWDVGDVPSLETGLISTQH